jgi:hypothetical protein
MKFQELTFNFESQQTVVLTAAILSIVFGLWQAHAVLSIKVGNKASLSAADEEK